MDGSLPARDSVTCITQAENIRSLSCAHDTPHQTVPKYHRQPCQRYGKLTPINTKKASGKSQQTFIIKALSDLGGEGNHLHWAKGSDRAPVADVTCPGDRPRTWPWPWEREPSHPTRHWSSCNKARDDTACVLGERAPRLRAAGVTIYTGILRELQSETERGDNDR